MSRQLKERIHPTDAAGTRASHPPERLPQPAPPAPPAPGALGHRVVAAAVAALLAATAVIWTASTLADGTTATPPGAGVQLEHRSLTGGVAFNP